MVNDGSQLLHRTGIRLMDVLHKNQAAGWRDQHPAALHDRWARPRSAIFCEINRSGIRWLPDPPLPKAKTAPPKTRHKILTLAVGSEAPRRDCSQLWRKMRHTGRKSRRPRMAFQCLRVGHRCKRDLPAQR